MLSVSLFVVIIAQKVFNVSQIQTRDFTEHPTKTTDKRKITLLLGGDVMLGRTVMTTSIEKADYTYPFLQIGHITSAVDVAFVNLENPIIENCPLHYTGFKFCASVQMLEGLKFAGIDIVSIANNHTYNYGLSGFEETKKHLNSGGILYTGDNELVVVNKNGYSLGFLGFDFVGKEITDNDMELISKSDKQVDLLIAGVHWGSEYTSQASQEQRNWAKKMVENGVDVIAGHHPHWVQNIEFIDKKPVFYSLGNLVFDQMWSEQTRTGKIVVLTYEERNITNIRHIKTYMQNWAQPAIR